MGNYLECQQPPVFFMNGNYDFLLASTSTVTCCLLQVLILALRRTSKISNINILALLLLSSINEYKVTGCGSHQPLSVVAHQTRLWCYKRFWLRSLASWFDQGPDVNFKTVDQLYVLLTLLQADLIINTILPVLADSFGDISRLVRW